jgi:hypothetical protein
MQWLRRACSSTKASAREVTGYKGRAEDVKRNEGIAWRLISLGPRYRRPTAAAVQPSPRSRKTHRALIGPAGLQF